MNVKLIIFTLLVPTMAFSGCATSNKPISGVVGWSKEASVGSPVPDIPFISMEGKHRTLSKIRLPITILVFTSTPGVACCRLEPELVTLADRFKKDPITVVQISLPNNKCPHGASCSEACNINNARLLSLCDADRIAWSAFHQPKLGTVFLVGENGKIVGINSTENLRSIADRAHELAQEIYPIEDFIYDED